MLRPGIRKSGMSINQSQKYKSEEVEIVRKTVLGHEAGYGGDSGEVPLLRPWTERPRMLS